VRRPSGTLVWGGRVVPGRRVVLHLPGARYRACAYQSPSRPYGGFGGCAYARYRTTPRIALSVRRRGPSLRVLLIRNGRVLAGARATVTLRGAVFSRRRVVRLKDGPVRLRLALPRRAGRVRVTVTVPAANPGELLLRAARAARSV
jgi:hypothetical protein